MTVLTGWGRYPRAETRLVAPHEPGAVAGLHRAHSGFVARGNGRAYGDAAIGADTTLALRGLDRFIAFDAETGLLTVEAGVLIAEIIDLFLPRGFFPFVVPGTKLVTVGGAIAADVHGKNHHVEGGFGHHVESLDLVLADGAELTCSRGAHPDLFAATLGGMGLTGTILRATIRLRRVETGWMRQRTVAAPDLDAAMAALEGAGSATYAVAWIDCLARGAGLGRSLVYCAEHATRADLADLGAGTPPMPATRRGALTVPFDMPGFTLNRLSVSAFNEVYYRRGRAASGPDHLAAWQPYFFPLDGVGEWNRIYGPRGFVQHQCVLPKATSRAALGALLDRVSRLGSPSFLAVLKLLGPGAGLISFPMEGYTLALDLPASAQNLALLAELDDIVREAGGRLYLAKDARQTRATFEAGYGATADRFRHLRREIGASHKIVSAQSRRLGL